MSKVSEVMKSFSILTVSFMWIFYIHLLLLYHGMTWKIGKQKLSIAHRRLASISLALPEPHETLLVIDGTALVVTEMKANAVRREKNGFQYGLVERVKKRIKRIADLHQPNYLAVAFDSGDYSRRQLYPKYKAKRNPRVILFTC